VVLTVCQIAVGLFAHAQSLVADGMHTLSDLLGDFMVMFASRHGANPADERHPYGHGRYETAASMVLGLILAGVGAGFLLTAGGRLQSLDALPELHPAALWMALVTLAGKEGLFRYMLAVAQRLRSPMLVANAWHARADAASSLVVAVGIGGSLLGYRFLEPLAAALVGFMILRMGVMLAYEALRELIDTGVDAEEVARIRETVTGTCGCSTCTICAPAGWPTGCWWMPTCGSMRGSASRKGIASPSWRASGCGPGIPRCSTCWCMWIPRRTKVRWPITACPGVVRCWMNSRTSSAAGCPRRRRRCFIMSAGGSRRRSSCPSTGAPTGPARGVERADCRPGGGVAALGADRPDVPDCTIVVHHVCFCTILVRLFSGPPRKILVAQ
jgi:cation diffusion facilitator family transporter